MKTTIATLKKMKEEGNRITMLTCYDYSTAKLMDEAGVEILLVGDSLGNTILGYEDTPSVTNGGYDPSYGRRCARREKCSGYR